MAKSATPSYILEFEFRTNSQEVKVLDKKMRIAKSIYNTCLGYAQKRLKAVLADKEYRQLVKEPSSKARNDRLREIERSYGSSEYQVHEMVSASKRHFGKAFGINEAQKLATRAFQAVEGLHYRKANRVNFKQKSDAMSVENKENTTGLQLKDGKIVWGELSLDFVVKKNDHYAQEGLCDRTKYVSILSREIRGEVRYFVQLVQEGLPPIKANRLVSMDETKRVGIDEGTFTAAIVSEGKVELVELAPECVPDNKKLRVIERAMDRSKRAANPDNYRTRTGQ